LGKRDERKRIKSVYITKTRKQGVDLCLPNEKVATRSGKTRSDEFASKIWISGYGSASCYFSFD